MATSSSTTSTRNRSDRITSSSPVMGGWSSPGGATRSPRVGGLLVLHVRPAQSLDQAPDEIRRIGDLSQLLRREARPVAQLLAQSRRIRIAELDRHFLQPAVRGAQEGERPEETGTDDQLARW